MLKTTAYFDSIRARPDRALIKDEWIVQAVENPDRETVQADGRIRRWARIDDADGHYLRVVVLSDGETITMHTSTEGTSHEGQVF